MPVFPIFLEALEKEASLGFLLVSINRQNWSSDFNGNPEGVLVSSQSHPTFTQRQAAKSMSSLRMVRMVRLAPGQASAFGRASRI